MKSALQKPTGRKAVEAPPSSSTLPSEQKSLPFRLRKKLRLSLEPQTKQQMKTVAATLNRDVSDILSEAYQLWLQNNEDERIVRLKEAGILGR